MKPLGMMAAAAMAVVMLAAAGACAADVTLRLAGVHVRRHYGHRMLQQVKADIEAAGVGLTVQLFPAGRLGSGEQLFDAARRGEVDIVHAFVYANRHPVLEINSLPFLATSWAEVQRVYGRRDSAYARIMGETLDQLGLKYLGTAVEGFIGVVASKKPQDHAAVGPKGLHIRVWRSQVAKDATEALGFETTTLDWSETRAALRAGALDGAICCTAQGTYTVFAARGIGKYYIPYNAFVEATTYYASQRAWEKLDAAQRAAVQAAVDRAAASFTDWAGNNEDSYLVRIRGAGWEVLDLSDAERAALTDHLRQAVWPGVEASVGKDVIDRLRQDR